MLERVNTTKGKIKMKDKFTNTNRFNNANEKTDCVSCQGLNRERSRRQFLNDRHLYPTQRQARELGLQEPVTKTQLVFENQNAPAPMPPVPACNHNYPNPKG